jgi:serine/threonine protein kinase
VESSLTLSGTTLGTPAYMAPEQASGERGISTAADVWSLGAVSFYLLAGRPPFTGESVADILLQARTQEPPSLRALNAAVPRDLETICLKCLEKDPARRYGSALALAEDLERWLNHEPIRARPTSLGERLAKWARRNPARATLATALLVMSLVGVGGITNGSARNIMHWHSLPPINRLASNSGIRYSPRPVRED